MARLSTLIIVTFVVTFVVLFAAITSYADTTLFAIMTNAQENPPRHPTTSTGGFRPESFGFATFTINDAMTAMTFSATVFNIDFTGSQSADVNDNLTLAHIHASPTVTPTSNAGVVWGFFGTPFNDNDPNDVVRQDFATGVGGTISGKWDSSEGNNTTLTAQLPNILSGHAYINFHTTQFGGGEVRGNIIAATKCPLGQEFWKNTDTELWPVTSLDLGGKTYTAAELLNILNTPVGGKGGADASLILAHQLIATKLSMNNKSDPTPVGLAITQADVLLGSFAGKLPYDVAPSSTIGHQMTRTAGALDGFNSGALTTSCVP
jgi:hypothetical protein